MDLLADDMSLIRKTTAQLRTLGHYLHYRMGGRVGRRRILTLILERGEILQKDLQETLHVQPASVSELIIKLEAEGLIEKTRSETDGRQLLLRLTPEGERQAVICRDEFEAKLCEMMSCLSEAEMEELSRLLGILESHWRDISDKEDSCTKGCAPHNSKTCVSEAGREKVCET